MASSSSGPARPSVRARQAQRDEAREGYLKELDKERRARAEKTARLKALRLAKEEAERAVKEATPAAPPKKRARTRIVSPTGRLI